MARRSACPDGWLSTTHESLSSTTSALALLFALNSYQRLLKETDYWDELGRLLAGRKVFLYITGEDVSGSYVKLREDEEQVGHPTICLLYRCGEAKNISFSLGTKIHFLWQLVMGI